MTVPSSTGSRAALTFQPGVKSASCGLFPDRLFKSSIITLHCERGALSGLPIWGVLITSSRTEGCEGPQALLPLFISPVTGRSTTDAVSLGAMGDSYYEYLLKVCCDSALSDWKGCRAAARTLLAVPLYKLQIVFKKGLRLTAWSCCLCHTLVVECLGCVVGC